MNIITNIPTKGIILRTFKKAIFGEMVRCPRCQSRDKKSVKNEGRYRCRSCFHPYSIKSCSWLKGSKLEVEKIWLLLVLYQQKIPIQQTMTFTSLSYPTVCNWYQKFRSHIPKERYDTLLKGEIACDELYTKESAVIGAKQKGTRNIMLKVIHQKSVERGHIVDFLQRFVQVNSELCTDGAKIYKNIGNWHNLKHKYEIHKNFEFTLTAEIEGLWGVFRTFIRRMYHHVTRYKLEDIVQEFCLRFRKDKVFQNPYYYWDICLGIKPFAL